MDSSGQNANPNNTNDMPVEPVVESTKITPDEPVVTTDTQIAQTPVEPVVEAAAKVETERAPEPEIKVEEPKVETEQVTTGVDFASNMTNSLPVKEPVTVEPEVAAPKVDIETQAEATVEPVTEVAGEMPATEATPEAATEQTVETEAMEEKPAVGAEAIAQDLQNNDALNNIQPLEQNLQAEAVQTPTSKPAPSITNTILIVLIVLSALVLAASIIAFFFVK